MSSRSWVSALTLAVATAALVASQAGAAFAVSFHTGPYNTDDNYLHAKALPSASYHTFVADPNSDTGGDFADWAKIIASAEDQPFVIETLSLGALTDTQLEVFDTDGVTLLEENDNADTWDFTLGSSIFFRAPHAGTFYVRLSNATNRSGSCWLYVNKGIGRRVGSGAPASVAAAVSKLQFSDTDNPAAGPGAGPGSVVVCNAGNSAEVIAAGVLADRLGTTVLFTDKKSLPGATSSEVNRLLMSYLWGGEPTTVYVVGGTGSVSSAVFDRLAGLTNVSRVRRLSASSAAGVATLVAQGGGHAWWPSSTPTHRVILVNSSNVVDGLLAASLAHGGWASVLYVNKTSMPSQTGALLASSDATSVYIMGGTNSISGATESWLKTNLPAATVLRLRGSSSGGSIYDLSHWVADWGVASGRLNNGSVVVVPGGAVVDAAAAVGISRQTGGPILFTPKTSLSSSVTGFIGDAGDLLQTSYVLGDSSQISDKTFEAFRTRYTAPLAP